jgi:hypothetical protein
MAVFSLFTSAVVSAFTDSVDEPIASQASAQLSAKERANALFHVVQEMELDTDGTRAIDFANYSTTYPNDSTCIILRVIGWVELQTVAKDTDDAATINGYQRAYGTTVLPGVLILSTYNVTSFTLKALSDNTKISILGLVLCDDDDSRYETYA